jgi:hypothetical protein
MNERPTGGKVILGIFMILFGLCITLVGGGCSVLWLGELNSPYNSGMGGLANPFLWISLITLAGGLACLWVGFKLLTGKFRE